MPVKPLIISIAVAVLLVAATWQAGRAGLARHTAELGARAPHTDEDDPNLIDVALVDRGVALSPNDAEVHYARGYVMQERKDYAQALQDYGQAVALRPRDYYLWMLLGVMREANQDRAGAEAALREAVALAPSYARTHWQLGNILLRTGNYDEAFAELRRAANSSPDLFPNVIDLAWNVYDKNVPRVIEVMNPDSDPGHFGLAVFFARHHEGQEALRQFSAMKSREPADKEVLLAELLRANAFRDAYQVWASDGLASEAAGSGALENAGFETPITIEQTGFGWRIAQNIANVEFSIDESEHQSGARSLRLVFRGDSDPGRALLTRMMVVKSSTKYRLSFWAKTKEFVSAGLPAVNIVDAADPQKNLAESEPSRADDVAWRNFSVEFTTGPATEAVVISLLRQSCPQSPCPAFGTLWLDSFSLSPL